MNKEKELEKLVNKIPKWVPDEMILIEEDDSVNTTFVIIDPSEGCEKWLAEAPRLVFGGVDATGYHIAPGAEAVLAVVREKLEAIHDAAVALGISNSKKSEG